MRVHLIMILGSLLIAACGGGDDDGGSLDCSDFSACGGDPVGEWTFVDGCFEGELDPGIDGCPEATGSVSNIAVEGTAMVRDDGTFAIDSVITGDVVVTVPADCLMGATCAQVSEFANADCTDNGDGCDCASSIQETTQESGTWEVEGDTFISTVDGEAPEEALFCVDGDVIKLQPQDNGEVTVTLVLTRG